MEVSESLVKKVENYVYRINPWDISIKFYILHINAVRKYALLLAKKLNADKKVVEIAALLHDVGRNRKEHHIESAKIAERLLLKFGCKKDFINNVTHCILVHRSSRKDRPKTIEAKILKDADALAFLDPSTGTMIGTLYWLWTKYNFEDGIMEMKNKIKRMHRKISTDYGKKLARPLYDQNVNLFQFIGDK